MSTTLGHHWTNDSLYFIQKTANDRKLSKITLIITKTQTHKLKTVYNFTPTVKSATLLNFS